MRAYIRRFALQVLEAMGIESFPHSSIAFRAARRLFRLFDIRSADLVHSIYRAVDFGRTKAFFPSSSGHYIRINVKGGGLMGSIDPGEPYEHLRTRIINELYNLRDPRTSSQVVEKVYRR